MLELTLTIIFISTVINGIYICMDEGMVLNPLWKRIEKLTTTKSGDEVKHHFLFKPLGGCLTCMASVYGSFLWWTLVEWNLNNLILWPMVILAVAFVNNIIYKLI